VKWFARKTILLACTLIVSPICFASDQPVVDCLVLKQSQSIAGTYKTMLSPDAIKMERAGSRTFLIARAPEWRVVFFNPANNNAIDVSLTDWIRREDCWSKFRSPAPRRDIEAFNRNVEQHGLVVYCGKTCVRYGMLDVINGRVDPNHRYWEECYVLPDTRYPKQELQILQKMLDLPAFDGIPLFSRMLSNPSASQSGAGDSRGVIDLFVSKHQLSTKEIVKERIPSSAFKYPQNFHKVERECDVIMDSVAKGDGDDAASLLSVPK
jgi:hypothetical protein